jgi:hypothetical protein
MLELLSGSNDIQTEFASWLVPCSLITDIQTDFNKSTNNDTRMIVRQLSDTGSLNQVVEGHPLPSGRTASASALVTPLEETLLRGCFCI